MNIKHRVLAAGIALATLTSPTVFAENDWEGDSRDAWIDGKLEGSYLLNSQLNNFGIDTDVENGVVTLSGTVESDVDKALAEQIAMNLEGVVAVTNDLEVGESDYEMDEPNRKFSTAFFDMTTTARLKTNFALNSELKASDINIDTKEGVVVLEGEVGTPAEKMLAEEIAVSYDYVTRVDNRLQIDGR
jgi:osmotically-inducible protein OsmY